jgi:Holliday junction resolvasome RuvABC endonuclease subunit
MTEGDIIRICCVDQSSHSTGITIMQTETQKIIYMDTYKDDNKEPFSRLYSMTKNVFEAFDKYNCELFTLENVYANGNMKAYNLLSQLQGMLIWNCEIRDVAFEIPLASQWRKSIGIKSKKRIDQKKEAVQFVNERYKLNLTDKQDDMAESCCIATAMSLKYKD